MKKSLSISGALYLMMTLAIHDLGFSQPFLSFGYGGGISRYQEINQLLDTYHLNFPSLLVKMNPVQVVGGPHLGAGYYTSKVLVEWHYTWDGFTRFSTNTDLGGLSISRNIRMRYHHISAILGIRPFESHYFTLGLALNLGSWQILTSQNLDFSRISKQFSPGNEVFMDFMLVSNQNFGLRLRPCYQIFYAPAELGPLKDFLLPGQVQAPSSSPMNNFGVKFSLTYLFKPRNPAPPQASP